MLRAVTPNRQRQSDLLRVAAVRPHAPALVCGGRVMTYAQLAEAVGRQAAELPNSLDGRCLVHLVLDRSVESVVAYLATHAAGHVALVVPDSADSVVAQQYSPDVTHRGRHFELALGWERPRHLLHPDLALLLSTSGSTGSPKLVRLSHRNLVANADAIAEALQLHHSDRGITALPLNYCYGLSVLHSHLRVGAGVVVHDGPALDPEFWHQVVHHQVTNVPLVPHTAKWALEEGMLDQPAPDLRLITQAGGRLAQADVQALSALGERRGWDFRVMYGQTEATARIAIQPGGASAAAPEAVGVALPGLTARLDHDVPEADSPEVGELVVAGDSVMMGYAEHVEELALGRMLDELRTGDLATIDDDGLIRIRGRRHGFLKIMGLRVDLARVEEGLNELGHDVVVTGDDERLRIAVAPGRRRDAKRAAQVRLAAARLSGLGPAAVQVAVTPLPYLHNGKVDRQGADALVRAAASPACDDARGRVDAASATVTVSQVAEELADVLAVDALDPHRSFVDQGGDSLSHVPAARRLNSLLGELPTGWHHLPLRDLVTPPMREGKYLETSVIIRAVAALMICIAHTGLLDVQGGAHVLLALAGWNAALFGLALPSVRRRARSSARAAIGIAVPTAGVALAGLLLTERYGWSNVLMAHWLLGDVQYDTRIELWFVDSLLASLLLMTALLAMPRVARLHRRDPWMVYAAVAAAALVPRFVTHAWSNGPVAGLPHTVFWLFAAGAALAVARTSTRRLITLAIVFAGLVTFFDDPARNATIFAGIVLLTFVRELRVPQWLVAPVMLLASASLYVYVVQFQVFELVPPTGNSALTAIARTLLAVTVGVVLWRVCDPHVQRLRNLVQPNPPRKDDRPCVDAP